MSDRKIRGRFDRPDRVLQENEGPDMAQQQFKEESDINTITSRYLKTGVLGNPNATRLPMFGDYSSVDFLHMQNTIADMEQQFRSLPSRVRGRFDNSPYQLVRFVENPQNYDECVRLGLLPGVPKPVEDPNQVKMPLSPRPEQAGAAASAAAKADPEAQPPPPRRGV